MVAEVAHLGAASCTLVINKFRFQGLPENMCSGLKVALQAICSIAVNTGKAGAELARCVLQPYQARFCSFECPFRTDSQVGAGSEASLVTVSSLQMRICSVRIWLSALVALKIARADTPAASHEAQMYERIKRSSVETQLKERIVTLLDSFVQSGPNGEHQCLVFQPMGPSNLLLSLRTLTAENTPQFVQQPTGNNTSKPIKRKDGKPDRWAPKYLCADRPITDDQNLITPIDVKISDLGAAFLIANPPTKSVTPLALRAPGIIFRMPFDHRIDIWSFGCLAFQFITNTALFAVCDWVGTPAEEIDDDHLLQMTTALGQLPARMTNKWDRHDKYFSLQLELIRSDVGPEEISEFPIHVGQTIEEMFDEQRPKCMASDEANNVLSFLKKVLQYEPEQRASTAEMLKDEWIKSIY
nr:serine/threonine-protein kinase srpk [Quercus suber]POE87638.1 serine/threonine-protein kinase srpk [Quercus suber]